MARKKTSITNLSDKYQTIPIDKLIVEGWNYKKEDEKLQKKLEENIKRNGQIENIIVRELEDGTYGIVNGHHRFSALQTIGSKEVMVFNLGKISLNAAKRIAVETNETKFESDNVALAELLKGIQEDFEIEDLSETMPFTDDELKNFSDMLEFDWEDDSANKKDDEEEDEETDGGKSSTVISAGGEKFKVVRLELAPDLAEFLEEQLLRFKKVGGTSERPLELILNYVSQAEDEEVLEVTQGKRKKRAKKRRK